MLPTAGVLLLALGLVGCADDAPGASAEASASPSLSASAEPRADRLTCNGGFTAASIHDYAGDAVLRTHPMDPPNTATPEEVAQAFAQGSTTRFINGWDPERPPVQSVVRTREGRNHVAHAYFRNPDGAVVAILDMRLTREAGWLVSKSTTCAYGRTGARPRTSRLPAAEVVVDRTKFSPRVQPEALELDCQGGSIHAAVFDRRPNFRAKPLRNPDAVTDGLAAFARRQARRDPGWSAWEGSRPPTTVLLFPRVPAKSMRAVIRFASPSGAPVVAIVVERDVPFGPWIVASYRACA
jgi:hypothetical protein